VTTVFAQAAVREVMKYVVLAVDSDAEADRLIQDLTENPDEPLRTPRWGNAVHARLTATAGPRPSADELVPTYATDVA
jgi:hypothetical protein